MKITLSQLRRVIKEEASLIIMEGAQVKPTGVITRDGAEIFVSYTSAPGGHFASLLASGIDARRVAKVYPSEHAGLFFIMGGPKGKWAPTKAGALALLSTAVDREVAKLSSNPDARPSEMGRLKLLKAFLKWSTSQR